MVWTFAKQKSLVRRIGNGCLACQYTFYAHIAKTLFNVQENKGTNPNRVLRISLIRFCGGWYILLGLFSQLRMSRTKGTVMALLNNPLFSEKNIIHWDTKMLRFKWTSEWLFVLLTRFLRTAHHPNDLHESNEILFIGLTVKNTQWDDTME